MSDSHIVNDNIDTDVLDPENACMNYEQCGNIVPYNGKACGDCLDRMRHNDR